MVEFLFEFETFGIISKLINYYYINLTYFYLLDSQINVDKTIFTVYTTRPILQCAYFDSSIGIEWQLTLVQFFHHSTVQIFSLGQ